MTSKERGDIVRDSLLQAIIRFIEEKKYPPTVRELCDITGLKSTSSIASHLTRMQIEGKISFNEESPRTIVVPGYTYVKIPEGLSEKQLKEYLESL